MCSPQVCQQQCPGSRDERSEPTDECSSCSRGAGADAGSHPRAVTIHSSYSEANRSHASPGKHKLSCAHATERSARLLPSATHHHHLCARANVCVRERVWVRERERERACCLRNEQRSQFRSSGGCDCHPRPITALPTCARAVTGRCYQRYLYAAWRRERAAIKPNEDSGRVTPGLMARCEISDCTGRETRVAR